MERRVGVPLLLAIVSWSLLSSCGESTTQWADSVTYGGLFRRAQEGITTGRVNDEVAIAIAHQLPEGYDDFAGGAGTGPDPAFVFREFWRHASHPDFDWRCEMSDTKTGTVTIDGDSFSLEKGRFFFIRVAGDSVHRYQYDIDVAKLETYKEEIKSETGQTPTLDRMFERIFPDSQGKLPPDVSGKVPDR